MDDSSIHTSLGLGKRGRNLPWLHDLCPLTRYREEFLDSQLNVCTVLPGATVTQSKTLLKQWCDSVITSYTKNNPLVTTLDGMREWEMYHHIGADELDKISSVLGGAAGNLGRYCTAHNVACRHIYTIRMRGLGSLTTTQQFGGHLRSSFT